MIKVSYAVKGEIKRGKSKLIYKIKLIPSNDTVVQLNPIKLGSKFGSVCLSYAGEMLIITFVEFINEMLIGFICSLNLMVTLP